jgi:hypothetical protein
MAVLSYKQQFVNRDEERAICSLDHLRVRAVEDGSNPVGGSERLGAQLAQLCRPTGEWAGS